MTSHARRRILLIVLFGIAGLPSRSLAQSRPPPSATQLSIEDLMNIDVTSVSRKQQHAADVAAALFVITQDDILHSGMTDIPDLLRLVPGVDVAQVNSNRWAVSVRGFNGIFANKLLVLVDGRSVYNRVYSGVFWETEDLVLDDIERIEVVRGPAAALWGANAVNGVINIVTKTAAESAGGLVRLDGGSSGGQGMARYGSSIGAANYRVFAQWTGRAESLVAPGSPNRVGANDGSHSLTAGFRADWSARPGAFTAEGAARTGQTFALWPNLSPATSAVEPIVNTPSDATTAHLLGRWTGTRGNGAGMQVQSFVDVASHHEPVGNYQRRAFDIDSQYHAGLGTHQDLVAGVGYRFIIEQFAGRGGFSLAPADNRASLITAFIQDEVNLADGRLAVTAGTQWQYDSDAGAGFQPTVRVAWAGLPRQRLWAAASRALRTPSLTDRGIQVKYPPVPTTSGLPLVVTLNGNPAFMTETFMDLEAGYRLEMNTTASIDVTGFVGRYEHLRTQEPATPIVQFVPAPQILATAQFGNQLAANTRGIEVVGRWSPAATLRFDASYERFHLTPHLASTSADPTASMEDGSAPHSQWLVRSVWSLSNRAVFNAAVIHAGALVNLGVPAWTRTDITAEWRFVPGVSLMLIGQNLFNAAHVEFSTVASALSATAIPRAVNLRLRWTFR